MCLIAPAILAAIIGAAGTAAGSIGGGAINLLGNKWLQEDAQSFNSAEAAKTREFNAIEAEKARDFTEYMQSTNYQRTLSDMEAAGLNPAALGAGMTPSGGGSSSSATSTPASSSANSFNSAYSLFDSSVLDALAHDKSFGKDLLKSMQTSAKSLDNQNDKKLWLSNLTPYDLMTDEQKQIHRKLSDRKIEAYKTGKRVNMSKAEKEVLTIYEHLSSELNAL